jgi:hypothetical protein
MRQRGINVSSFAHRNQRAAASELEVWAPSVTQFQRA